MIYVLGVRLDGEPFLLKRKTLATCSLFPKFYFVGGEFSGGWKTFLEQPLEFRLESVCGATCNLFEKKMPELLEVEFSSFGAGRSHLST